MLEKPCEITKNTEHLVQVDIKKW